ncbi:nicotinate-nucleotide--dimethylbenzimidazole phosphoribosyltransferase [Robbsia sp. Bb-Pol-6]|uniref:Nicotinate-nucleotide--dimethylbenzimidazole phosphoribosyltransferase n=1 Tax=Robbsia betulipollinis TaxID=2981849 RepID=A0ABT3ZSB2_9BURK|nr:nicotinate-nucleotide--dimethylbenzimidazole phosphoribosyltransferase [Robbsia betulipollinis]MCY0389100.1 nicotinate-nucleotide--dimethylbenzimidazole phosphoribosyltransferase [Robbsia betulipollinis]
MPDPLPTASALCRFADAPRDTSVDASASASADASSAARYAGYVHAPDATRRAGLQAIIDAKTKPPGSLGRIESLALQIGLIQQTSRPTITRPAMLVFAGDHGIVRHGVSPYPQAVTAQMVANFIAGGAAINVFSALSGLTLEVINAGVACDLPDAAMLVNTPIGLGTRDFSEAPAMSDDEVRRAMALGAARVAHHAARGTNTIGFGEMGIGNTSAAACLMSRYCALPIDACVGRGTGLDDAGLARKRGVLAKALSHHPQQADAMATLAFFGGFEIAAMAGAFIEAAARDMIILVDGFVVTAALLAALAIAPDVRHYCVFSHVSDESGHRAMLERLAADPLLALGLRLGEGTGAALALPLVRAAAAFLCDMASFASAGIDDKAHAGERHDG